MKKVFLILGLCVLFFSCKQKEDLSVCTAVNFEKTIININENEDMELTVEVQPDGTLEYNNLEISVLNETIAKLEKLSEPAKCKITGMREGATIISAVCQNVCSKAVINVFKKETDSARNIVNNDNEDKWYLYTLTYKENNEILTQCFYKTKPYDYSVQKGIFSITKENGIVLDIYMADLIDINFQEEK